MEENNEMQMSSYVVGCSTLIALGVVGVLLVIMLTLLIILL